jgi:hypothetical protein
LNRTKQPSGIGFLELDVDSLCHDLRLDHDAKVNGSSGLPAPEQTYEDGPERKIRQEVIRRVEDAKGRAISEEKALRSAIKGRQLAPAVMRSGQILQDCEDEFRTSDLRLRAERGDLRARLAELRAEIETYARRYGLTRGPRITDQEDRNRALVALGVLSLAQLGGNAALFAQGSAFGLAFGLGLAVLVAFFDIGLHFNLGRWASRVLAPDRLNRWIGGAAIGSSVATVLAFNLGTVHLRRVSRAAEGAVVADWDRWLPGLLSDPFGFTDFLSWILFGLGALCSMLAVGSGWLWNYEPIPLFRRNGTLISRLEEDLRDVEEERAFLAARLVQGYEQKLDALDRQAETHVSIIADSVGRIHQLVADYESYCATARETFVALVSRYRDQNRIHRDGAPVPEFFRHAPNIELNSNLPISLDDLDELQRCEQGLYEELQQSLRASRHGLRALGSGRAKDALGLQCQEQDDGTTT